MPEGDSIHRVAARLQPLVGHRVAAESPHPRGLLTGVAAAVDGRVLESVVAVGKHVLLRFEGRIVVRSHLRMSGRWRVGEEGVRQTGSPWLILRAGRFVATQWNGPVLTLEEGQAARLGPDIIAADVDVAALVARFRRADPEQLLGEALLDQRLVAGLGNLWMAECLWASRLSPWLPIERATDVALSDTLAWAQREMRAAVAGRRPPRSVYRRVGRPCLRCVTPIRSGGLGVNNRTAYWCGACQRIA